MRSPLFVWSAILASVLIAGCANHPLVDDKVGLSTSEIIHKIRCDAAEALRDYHAQHGFRGSQLKFDGADKELKDLEAKLTKAQQGKQFAELRSKGAVYDADEKRVRAAALWTDRQVRALYAVSVAESKKLAETRTALDRVREQLASDPANETLLNQAIELAKRVIALQESVAGYNRRWVELDSERMYLESLQGSIVAAGKEVAAALKVQLGQEKRIAELGKIIKEPDIVSLYQFRKTSVAMQFRFDITETNTARTANSVKFPIYLGSFMLDFGGGLDKKRRSERVIGLEGKFDELMSIDCSDASIAHGYRARIYPLTGNVGMRELMQQYLNVIEDTQRSGRLIAVASSAGSKKQFTDKLVFTTTVDGNVKPKVDIKPTPGHSVTSINELSAKREDIHEVIVDIAPPGNDPDKPGVVATGPQVIRIDQFPEIGIRNVRDVSRVGPSNSAP